MEKDKIFFGESGLTTTSANYTANLAKEAYRLLEDGLNQIRYYTTYVGLLSSDEPKELRVGDTKEQLSQLENSLRSIADLKTLIAWLREAIKAKERLIKEASDLSNEEVCKILGITMPERPKMGNIPDEDDIVATYDIKKRTRIYHLNTLCAELGSFIHVDGTLARERTKLQKILTESHKMEGSGRDAVLYTYKPTVTVKEVDDVFFKLQKKYREYQAELNSMFHEIGMAVQDAARKITLEYEEATANYNNEMSAINARIKVYKDEKIAEAQSLKITIPNNLKPIYDEVSKLGKK